MLPVLVSLLRQVLAIQCSGLKACRTVPSSGSHRVHRTNPALRPQSTGTPWAARPARGPRT